MTNDKIKKIDQLINRTNMQKNKLLYQEKRAQISSRKARTRTLIQIGGLLEKANLLEEFDIQAGQDLQDPTQLDKAAKLLGFLKSVHDENDFNSKNMKDWKTLGEAELLKK